jgi:hypothetical protein
VNSRDREWPDRPTQHHSVFPAGCNSQAMPCVWWPWTCQLVFVEVATRSIVLGFVSREPCRVRGTNLLPGTPFSIRLAREAQSQCAELEVIASWTDRRTTVTILAGRDGRSSWVCLSRGHERVILTEVRCDIPHPGAGA